MAWKFSAQPRNPYQKFLMFSKILGSESGQGLFSIPSYMACSNMFKEGSP